MPTTTPRILLAKIGLDGHDRGVKVVARGMRDAGFHVIYAGLWQTPEAVVRAAGDEDVDWLGLSLLSGAHMTLVPKVVQLLKQADLKDIGVMVGGIIPEGDVPKLKDIGVDRVFGPGTPIPEIVQFVGQDSNPDRRGQDWNPILQRCQNGDRKALSQLLTLAAQGNSKLQTQDSALSTQHSTLVLAITGSGGVGKSTLIGKLIEYLRSQNKTVAVLACDPQSPITGGALLGDRIRMQTPPEDEGVFIRSLATPGGQEAIASNLRGMIDLLSVYGFDVVLVETVGAGQGDTAIRQYVDKVVVLLQPESGDELQWEKAGLLEIGDVVVVHKADLPGAESMQTRLNDLLNLPGSKNVPVVLVSSSKNTGFPGLWNALTAKKQ